MVVGSSLVIQQSVGMNMTTTEAAYATSESPYDMGRDMGCNDASSGLPQSSQLAGHTADFVEGYYEGYRECDNRQVESPPQSSQQGGGIDWNAACQVAHTFLGLQTPCDQLVTPNNELTEQGERALACYLGGALLPLVNHATAAQLYTLGKQICPR
jgi:hypothetical protein